MPPTGTFHRPTTLAGPSQPARDEKGGGRKRPRLEEPSLAQHTPRVYPPTRFSDVVLVVSTPEHGFDVPGDLWPPISAFSLAPVPLVVTYLHISFREVVNWLKRCFHYDEKSNQLSIAHLRGSGGHIWVTVVDHIFFMGHLSSINRAIDLAASMGALPAELCQIRLRIEKKMPSSVPAPPLPPPPPLVPDEVIELSDEEDENCGTTSDGNNDGNNQSKDRDDDSGDDSASLAPSSTYFNLSQAEDDGPQTQSGLDSGDSETWQDDDEPNMLDDEDSGAAVQPVFSMPGVSEEMLRGFRELLVLTDEDVARNSFQMPGLKKPIFLYQAFSAVWLLARPTVVGDLHGGILADETGLGKTVQMLFAVLLSHQLLRRRVEVEQYHANPSTLHPRPHLPAGARKGEACPSSHTFWLQCPCEPDGAASRIARTIADGPAFVLVPPELISTWIREVGLFLDSDPSNPDFLRVDIFCSENTARANPSRPVLDVATRRSLVRDPTLVSLQIDAAGRPKERAWRIAQGTGLSGFVVVAPKSTVLYDHVDRVFGPIRSLTKADTKLGKPDSFWLSPGRIVVDEFHKAKGDQTKFVRWLEARKKLAAGAQPPPSVWFLTATPMDRGPSDIKSAVGLLERQSWSAAGHTLHRLCSAQFGKLSAAYTAAENNTGADNDKLALFVRLATEVLRPLIIRRRLSDRFLDVPLTAVGADTRDTLTKVRLRGEFLDATRAMRETTRLEIRALLEEMIASWSQGGRQGPAPTFDDALGRLSKKSHNYFRLRAAADLPALLLPDLRDLPLRFQDLARHVGDGSRRDTEALHHPYINRLDRICAGSPKLPVLLQILDTVLADRQPMRGETRVVPKKMVVLSYSPAVAQVVAFWLRRQRPSVDVELLLSNRNMEEREKVVQDFEMYEGPGQQLRGAQVLVSTMKLLGTGVNLTRANYMVLVDLEWMKRDRDQARGRVTRLTQRHSVYIYQLLNQDNPAELSIYNRQVRRMAVGEAFWDSTDDPVAG